MLTHDEAVRIGQGIIARVPAWAGVAPGQEFRDARDAPGTVPDGALGRLREFDTMIGFPVQPVHRDSIRGSTDSHGVAHPAIGDTSTDQASTLVAIMPDDVAPTGRIRMEQGLTPVSEFRTTVHESAHALNEKNSCMTAITAMILQGPEAEQFVLRIEELNAELTAAIVCEYAGIGNGRFSMDYLDGQSGGDPALITHTLPLAATFACVIAEAVNLAPAAVPA